MHECMCRDILVWIYVYMSVSRQTCIYVHTNTLHICMHTTMYIYIYTHTFRPTYINNLNSKKFLNRGEISKGLISYIWLIFIVLDLKTWATHSFTVLYSVLSLANRTWASHRGLQYGRVLYSQLENWVTENMKWEHNNVYNHYTIKACIINIKCTNTPVICFGTWVSPDMRTSIFG